MDASEIQPGTDSSRIFRVSDIYNRFKDSANTDKVYGEKIPSLIRRYKALFNQNATNEEIQKAFIALGNEVARNLFIVPFRYDTAHEFQNDKVLHFTPKAGHKLSIESIVCRGDNMSEEQMSKLYWVNDANTTLLCPDLDWLDISRISGSAGFSFDVTNAPRVMYPRTGSNGKQNFFLCFTGIDQYLKVFGGNKELHIALFAIDDIVEYMSASANISGMIINPDTETHCFIGKNAF